MNENPLIEKIHKSFTTQAAGFETDKMSFTKQEYLDDTVRSIELLETDKVLEVASGTCACGRAIAPHVCQVTCVDATPAMLAVGRAAAEKDGLSNIQFTEGLAEHLPFDDAAFDVIVTRLSFHHFSEMEQPFREMCRVLKKGGKLAIIDMEAAPEELRETEDKIETLRDFSHVKNRSFAEFEALFRSGNMKIVKKKSTPIPVELGAWMNLTKTPAEVQAQIRTLMETELNGGDITGFAPYRENGEIFFQQRWLFLLGIKE